LGGKPCPVMANYSKKIQQNFLLCIGTSKTLYQCSE
jgi:hypothetical protein